jgi:transposase-like protein
MTKQRYRAVLEVEGGAPVTEVAERSGVSRQAVHRWLGEYRTLGLEGLPDGSHHPHSHPAQTSAEVSRTRGFAGDRGILRIRGRAARRALRRGCPCRNPIRPDEGRSGSVGDVGPVAGAGPGRSW